MTLEQRLLSLEKRVLALENKVNTQEGLKVVDLDNKKITEETSTGSQRPRIPKEKENEIMEQINNFQKKNKENQKLLDKLMNEDF